MVNPFMWSRLFYHNSLDMSKFYIRCVWLIFINTISVEVSVFYANSVDPDQTPHSVASDLGLHCFANVPFMGSQA